MDSSTGKSFEYFTVQNEAVLMCTINCYLYESTLYSLKDLRIKFICILYIRHKLKCVSVYCYFSMETTNVLTRILLVELNTEEHTAGTHNSKKKGGAYKKLRMKN